MFAKFISKTKLEIFYGVVLHYGGRVYIHPTPHTLKQAGYLPCKDVYEQTPPPRHFYACDGQEITCYEMEEECL
ncbi:MAG: hypothetical protein J6R42_02960 [Clostridia bacterium]|nr:hypothetical protein [Clostridia bacterium]